MRRVATLVISMAVASVTVPWPTDRSDPASSGGAGAVVQVCYYARPGEADEVLSQRQRASDLLEKLGLPRGRVMRRSGGSDEGPDVLWECEFPSRVALDRALAAARADSELEDVRTRMGTLVRKAELRIWEVREPSGSGRVAQ